MPYIQTIQYLIPFIMYKLSKLLNLLIFILFIMNESCLDVTENQRTCRQYNMNIMLY